MVWGCIFSWEVGWLSKVNGMVNMSKILFRFGKYAYSYAVDTSGITDRWTFWQDNASCYTSVVAKECFDEEDLQSSHRLAGPIFSPQSSKKSVEQRQDYRSNDLCMIPFEIKTL